MACNLVVLQFVNNKYKYIGTTKHFLPSTRFKISREIDYPRNVWIIAYHLTTEDVGLWGMQALPPSRGIYLSL